MERLPWQTKRVLSHVEVAGLFGGADLGVGYDLNAGSMLFDSRINNISSVQYAGDPYI